MDSTHLIRNCSWLAALTCLLWDSVSVWPQEYDCIWRSRSSVVKWLYIISRYCALITQIANCILFFGPLSRENIPRKTCTTWFSFNVGATVCLYLVLEATLTIRVWALYQEDKRIRAFIVVAFIVGSIFTCIANAWTVFGMKFSAECIGFDPPKIFTYMWVWVVLTQISLMLLAINKKRIAERDGWASSPLMKVLLRDSAWIFVAMIAFAVAISPYAFKVNMPAHFMVAWPVTLLSIMTCRVVLNMLTMNTLEDPAHTEMSTNVAFDPSGLHPNFRPTAARSVLR